MLPFYQHLPEKINPIVFSIGLFDIRWYSLMYLVAFFVVYALLKWRAAHDFDSIKFSIFNFQFSNKIPNPKSRSSNLILDFLVYAIIGLLVGGRLGYVLFYNLGYYLQNPMATFSPYDFATGTWTGIFGMSYFGGALGVIWASCFWTRKNKIDFWAWSDFVLPAIPVGYFFGRVGNFLNGELYGRITEKPWGMYFPVDFGLVLRHPSQLYEAFFEGAVIFIILWIMRGKFKYSGQSLVVYLFFYGFFRFGIEFFREVDPGAKVFLGHWTLGQLFCLGFMALAIFLQGALSKRKKAV